MDKHIQAPITKEVSESLRAGDYIYITGIIYTARDAAHKRMDEALARGEALPINIEGPGDLLYGTISCKRRAAYWISRTYNSQPDG